MEKSFQENNLSGLGMGTWGIGEDASKKKDEIAALRYGLDNGIKVIDTAEMYGEGKSEKLIGEAIQGYDRSQIFLISKFYPYHASPELERQSLENSLKRLKTDYLDLYLLHWRGDKRLSETVRGLKELQNEGLIRHWGVSNFDVADLEELFSVPGGKDCFANEDLYNLSERRHVLTTQIAFVIFVLHRPIGDLCRIHQAHGVGFIGYSPFNSGKGDSIRITNNLKIVARAHNVTPHQIMLAWTLRHGNVLSIPKAGTVKHMKENIDAQDIKLTSDEIKLIDNDFPQPTEKTPLAMI